MSSKPLKVTLGARGDLVEIARFSSQQWGEKQAEHYLRQLDARMRRLVKNAKMGRRCRDGLDGYYLCREGRHVIYFRRVGKTVTVVRVLHQRMMPSLHLRPL